MTIAMTSTTGNNLSATSRILQGNLHTADVATNVQMGMENTEMQQIFNRQIVIFAPYF